MAFPKEKIHIKHIELWIIGFVIALGLAIFGFTFALVGREPAPVGLFEIEPLVIDKVKGYALDFQFYQYLDNEGKTTNDKYNELCEIYSNKLSSLYATTHSTATFEGYTSISQLSKIPNTDIAFDSETYQILLDAYNKTMTSSNYSVFADELYSIWNGIANEGESRGYDKDPLYNADTQALIDSLLPYIHNRNHVDLLFKDNNVINLKVSNEYQEFLAENEITPVYVSLNILRNNYILDALTKEVEAKGYNNGYFYMSDGTVTQLSKFKSGSLTYGIYTIDDNDNSLLLGELAVGSPNTECSFNRFNLNKEEYKTYYIIEKDGVKYYRSQYIDIHTGLCNNTYLNSTVFTNTVYSLESAFTNNELVLCQNSDEIRTYLDAHKLQDAIMFAIFNDNSKNIYITQNLTYYVSLSKLVDYQLVTF